MSFLTNLRVLPKILAIILLLSSVTAGVTVLGIMSLRSLSDDTDVMKVAAKYALDAAKLDESVVAINRAEYRMGSDPRAENIAEARKAIDSELKRLNDLVAKISNTTDADARKSLDTAKKLMEKYIPEIQSVVNAASAVKNFQMTDELARLRDTIVASRATADELNTATRTTANRLDARVDEYSQEANDEYHEVSKIMMLVAGISVVFGLAIGFVIGQYGIAKPLRELVRPLESIANGDFAVVVPGVGRKDEVGQIASSVAQMAEKVSSTIGEIKASGREVTNASAEISTSTTDLSQRTEEQAASLEETSAAMEELSATVRKNAENAQQANQSANSTRDVADRGGKVVAQAVEAMAKIEDSSRKISDIIGVIDEIARQTNLLALNAAVEAARAGEAGRGFAVVASEVRSLAQRSSQAAKDIKDLITNSNGQVKDGVELVNKAGESLTEIVKSIKEVAVVVADIANASIEQATGIEQINKALTQMDEVTQQNSALVEENAATAKTLEHQAKAMDEQVAFFKIAAGDDSYAGRPMADMPGNTAAAPKPAIKPNTMAAGKPVARSVSKPGPAARKPTAVPAPVANDSEPTQRAAHAGPARGMQTALATAVNGEDWREF
jgi:methyl-accepting chemotaxis protein